MPGSGLLDIRGWVLAPLSEGSQSGENQPLTDPAARPDCQ